MRRSVLTGRDALTVKLWHDLAIHDQTCAFTNTPLWISTCAETLGWEPACFAWESEEVVVPFIIRRQRGRHVVLAESQPRGQLGGPLAAGGIHRDLGVIVKRDLETAALEFLIYPACGRFMARDWEESTHKFHRISFDAPRQRAEGRASRKCASAARSAIRNGVEIVRVTGGPYLDATIDMHKRQQRGRWATVYPTAWWRRLVEETQDHVGLWSAVYDGQVLAALLVAWWNVHGIALVSASEPTARPLKAGNLLYLAVLEELEALGLKDVDLGGSRGSTTLESFKESVGARPSYRVFYRYRHPLLRMYQRIFSHDDAKRLTAETKPM
jgi:hypothetical protein